MTSPSRQKRNRQRAADRRASIRKTFLKPQSRRSEPLTIETANTPLKMAKLFEALVEENRSTDRYSELPSTMNSVLAIIREHHGRDGGPFAGHMEALQRLAVSDLQYLAERLESLPVNWNGLDRYEPLYFVLQDNEWTPCYNAEDNRDASGWITGGVRHEDGSTTVIPAPIGQWADCDADGNPSMPFVEW